MTIKSKYFTYEELTVTHAHLNNVPNAEQLNAMQLLTITILDPLRELYGHPIKVNSCFRSKAVNESVGGVATSHHTKGMAADLTCTDNKLLFELIKKNFKFTQLINEQDLTWVHVSYDPKNLKNQLLKL